MVRVFRNPITILVYRLFRSIALEIQFKKKSLKISGSSSAVKCSFGEKNTIYSNVFLNGVCLGDLSYIAANTRINNTKIGNFCSIGPDCRIGIGKHPAKIFVSTHPAFFSILKQAQVTFVDKNYFEEAEEIIIANDVWVGANVVILDGVNISDGVIVAAGSIVTKDIPPYAIVAGVPAKVIKYRFDKEEIDQLLKIKWWEKDIKFLENNYKKFHDIKGFIKSQE